PGHPPLALAPVSPVPAFAVVFHDPVPRPPPQAFLFRAGAVAPSPSDVGHALLLYFLGGPFPHEHEDRRLRYNQVLLAFERDLDSRLPEEQAVVADLSLHWEVLDVRAVDLPRPVFHARGLGPV